MTVVGDVDLGGDFSGLQVLTRALRLDQTIPHTGETYTNYLPVVQSFISCIDACSSCVNECV